MQSDVFRNETSSETHPGFSSFLIRDKKAMLNFKDQMSMHFIESKSRIQDKGLFIRSRDCLAKRSGPLVGLVFNLGSC